MRNLWKTASVLCVGISTMISFASTSASADNHVISATSRRTWQSDQGESSGTAVPLEVDVKVGDTIEIQIPTGNIPHGFVTIDGRGDASPSAKPDFVLACGQDPMSNPNAVLQEIGCVPGMPTHFGKIEPGCIKLQVLPNFPADPNANVVNFWCLQHTSAMWGMIKLISQ
jgi:hypothetical protein